MKTDDKVLRKIQNECYGILCETLYPFCLARHPQAKQLSKEMDNVWNEIWRDLPWNELRKKDAFLKPLYDAMGALEDEEQKRAFRQGMRLAITGKRTQKKNARSSPQHRRMVKVLRVYRALLPKEQARRLVWFYHLNRAMSRAQCSCYFTAGYELLLRERLPASINTQTPLQIHGSLRR